ncbi:hypothetical protein LJC14_07520 [Treponema sp. OttesenSCG-928-L16]|nr:hypothetical protein [Treponema sp. OttesenSCG-928-L16]
MRKNIAPLIVLSCFLAGCASMGKGLSDYSPVGIVSVSAFQDIPWYNEEGKPESSGRGDNKLAEALFGKKDDNRTSVSTADSVIAAAEKIVLEKLSSSNIAEFAGKDIIFNSRTYKEAESNSRMERDDYIPAPGYKLIDSGDKDFAAALAAETGIKSSMFITFDFGREMASGLGKNGTMRGKVNMKIVIRDGAGKSIYNKTISLNSSDKIPVSSALYDGNELIILLETAVSDACDEFIAKL